MRFGLCGALMCLALPCVAGTTVVRWPDANIPIPPEVRGYILGECARYEGFSEESIDECIRGESYGYRAVVMMLQDATFGEGAAERYRGCAAGLGDLGGRFHRRRAECISEAYCVVWRFEFTRETEALGRRFANLGSEHMTEKSTATRDPG